MTLVRALLAEVIGTFILVGVGSLAIASAAAQQLPVLLVVPFGFGLALLAAITIFGHVSGGHFNPAVTFGALLDGRIDVPGAIGYWVAQLVGAIGASLMFLVIFSSQDAVAATMTTAGVGPAQAFAVETIMTAIFVAVILTVTERQPSMAPLVIALTLTVIHFAVIPISGASVNPARSLAPAIVAGKLLGTQTPIWVYLAGPMLGGLIGWSIYRLVSPEEESEEDLEPDEHDDDELEDEPSR